MDAAGLVSHRPGTADTAQLLGDGMVPVNSALARNRDPAKRLAFAEDRQVLIEGVGHLNLLSDERVAAQLLAWLKALA